MNSNNYPKRLRRSESFFGIHFDFHASDECKEIGKNTTHEMIEDVLQQVRPDYVQCDCKGHRGLSSYPTKVGNPAPGVVKDALRIWRDVTAKHGVALFLHYSGVWDQEALSRHPEWACIDENGQHDLNITSVFGSYVDELLIPQLKELCDQYNVDGVWLDGECWAVKRDYCKKAIEDFKNQMGISRIPYKPEDMYFYEYTEFCRKAFRRYVKHYVDEMHKHNKDFQIASNWAFTSMMPEPVTIGVDFISGDYTPQDSLNSARLEGRCMARQGTPWDLMAWSFSFKTDFRDFSTKTPIQMKQEAAIVLALGGGFQAYFMQKPDGSVIGWQVPLMKEIADFCRARQEFCHRTEAVPQIALLYSSKAFYKKNTRVFSHWNGDLIPLQGILHSLLESQNAVEIIMEHQLTGHLHEYPLIIIPEWEFIEENLMNELLCYVSQGGNLLIIGAKACRLFERELKITFEGNPEENLNCWLEHNQWLACIRSTFQKVKTGEGIKPWGRLMVNTQDNTSPFETAASIAQYGRGRIAGVYFNMGQRYFNARLAHVRIFLQSLVRELFPNPIVEVRGSQFVDVTVQRKNGKLIVNLVNTAGIHGNMSVCTYDEIPPVGPLHITIRYGEKPERIILQPEGQELCYRFQDDFIEVELECLKIHSILVFE